ncbi:MAG: hypothetical protein K0V04_18020 [Deltaproteobacteria bacterium]|nr:hypothetical protein [Deltaproteobacteria bacterium]
MGHPIHRISTIARPVEPKYPTNLAILIVMGVCGTALCITALVRGAPAGDAALAGLYGALVVFITWALGRELAPDDNPAAFVALLPIAAVVLLGTSPMLLGALLTVGAVRVANRSVGPPAMLVDRIALVALAFVVAREGYGWSVGVAVVVSFVLDAVSSDRERRGWIFAGLAAAATVGGAVTGEATFAIISPGPWTIAAIVVAVAFAAVTATQPPPQAACDVEAHGDLRRDRVQGGMLVGLVAAAGSLLGGDVTTQAWGVLWAAMAGVVATRPLHLRLRG